MAYKKVVPPTYEPGGFYKFNAIGDKFGGWYCGKKDGKFNVEYKFRKRDGSTLSIDPPTHLRSQLEKAEADGDLKEGYAVIMTKTGEKQTGQANPMGLFEVQIDDSPSEKMPGAKAAAPKQAQEDVPF